MMSRALKGFVALLSLCFFCQAYAGYRTYLDPRSMAMGGTGVASSTKFNASFHNPALIAFNRGDKPDKIYISTSAGIREFYNYDLESDIRGFQEADKQEDFIQAVQSGDVDSIVATGKTYLRDLRDVNLSSYRSDEMTAFSLMVDTRPLTINFYTRRDVREMTVIRNRDEDYILDLMADAQDPNTSNNFGDVSRELSSSVDNTYFEVSEFGVTVATTDVIDYNMPISWGFTPKLMQLKGSHRATPIMAYEIDAPPEEFVSRDLLEWNVDVGFALLLTDDYLKNQLGLDGAWLEGEWVFGFTGMNMIPSDFTPYKPPRPDPTYPGTKRAIQALYQIGLAHYREDFMLALDIDLGEREVYDFEGKTRFVSLGGEYYWRDDFHLRGGLRVNTAQTSEAAREKMQVTAGFMYQPRGFSIEAAVLANDVETGGTIGFGLAF